MTNSDQIEREIAAFINYPKEHWPPLLNKRAGKILWEQVANSYKNVANLGKLFQIISASSSAREELLAGPIV